MNAIERKFQEWRDDPLAFIAEVVDDRPRWDAQREIIEAVRDNRITLVKSPHGMGKSFVASDVVLWYLITHPQSIVVTTAPSWHQVESILWSEVSKKAKALRIKFKGMRVLQTRLEFGDRWFAFGFSPAIEGQDKAARITGYHAENMLIVFDEAPSIDAALWTYVPTIMTAKSNKLLAIGNPIRSDGDFYQRWIAGDCARVHIDIFRSPNFTANGIDLDELYRLAKMAPADRTKDCASHALPMPWLTTPEWAAQRIADWGDGSPLVDARVLGELPRTAVDTDISYAECERALLSTPSKNTQCVIGVDVARFGTDDTVIIGYKNGVRVCFERRNGADTVWIANRIKALVKEHRADRVVVDDTGVGGGVTDQLNDWSHVEVMPINFAQSAIRDDVYADITTEMMFIARDAIRKGEVRLVDDGFLLADLTGRKYTYDSSGRYKVERKADYKKRIGRSPDDADAFILCMYGLCMDGAADIAVGDNYEKARHVEIVREMDDEIAAV